MCVFYIYIYIHIHILRAEIPKTSVFVSQMIQSSKKSKTLFPVDPFFISQGKFFWSFSYISISLIQGYFPGGSEVKESTCNAGDPGSIPGSGKSPGEGNGNPLQYSCLENPMNPIDGEAWQSTFHRVTESDTPGRLHFFTSSHSKL